MVYDRMYYNYIHEGVHFSLTVAIRFINYIQITLSYCELAALKMPV